MSYLLQFPPRPLPPGIRSPPYVLFRIRNVDVSRELPQDIPLAMVVHFIPKMKAWVYPPGGELHRNIISYVIRKDPIGIDIKVHIDKKALLVILRQMLQAGGIVPKSETVVAYPTLWVSVKVLDAWRKLDLPEAGLWSLKTYIHTRVMMGGPVVLSDMQVLWDLYPKDSPVITDMAHNYLRSHINFSYASKESKALLAWIRRDNDRKAFFAALSYQYGDSSVYDVPGNASKSNEGAYWAGSAMPTKANSVLAVDQSSEILERTGTRKVSSEERKERESKDRLEMRRKLRRLKSDESIRSIDTVIHGSRPSPLYTPEGQDKERGLKLENNKGKQREDQDMLHLGTGLDTLFQAVEASLLTKALKKWALERPEDGSMDEKDKSNE